MDLNCNLLVINFALRLWNRHYLGLLCRVYRDREDPKDQLELAADS